MRKLYAEGVEPETAPPVYRYAVPEVVEPPPSRKPKKKWKAPRLGVDRAAGSSSQQSTDSAVPQSTQASVEADTTLPSSTPAVSDVTRAKNSLSDGTGALFGTEVITAYSEQANRKDSKWRVIPHFRVSVANDSNPFLGAQNNGTQNKKSDVILTLSPGVSIRLGNEDSPLYLTADYTAGIVLFGSNTGANSLDHSAKVGFRWKMPKLTVGVNLGFQAVTGSNIDVGERVRRATYYAGLTSTYAYSEKISFDLNADLTVPDYTDQSFLDSREIRVQGFVNYQFSEKLQFGLGGTLGFLEANQGDSQTYEQGLLRVIYAASDKLAFNASVGMETRQTNAGGDFSPVFSLGLVYKPFDGTTISLDGRRRTYASAALTGQNYEATGLVASVSQRFMKKFNLSLAAGFEQADYKSALIGVAADRTDDYFFIRPGIDWAINKPPHRGNLLRTR